jgi:hypothetical protein
MEYCAARRLNTTYFIGAVSFSAEYFGAAASLLFRRLDVKNVPIFVP